MEWFSNHKAHTTTQAPCLGFATLISFKSWYCFIKQQQQLLVSVTFQLFNFITMVPPDPLQREDVFSFI